ncbi:MAG: glycosyl hydrolase 115 family protein, partial [Lachnospiraceae bacterium]
MGLLALATQEKAASFWVEDTADAGIRRVAEKVVEDFNRITGRQDELHVITDGNAPQGETVVCFGCYGKSSLLADLEKMGKVDFSPFSGKWEVYGTWMVEAPFPGVKEALVIAGSDKRGTIYGMFSLSELMGVTPLSYWADAVLPKKTELVISVPEIGISKEPSVKYRGFFINDEWPCFGNWTVEHFDGFTAEMYDKVFELLLRLKGNYLWPAMWSSSFALDGPGTASAELADMYGIVIGNSHHEPCLRASEEWDKVRGENSIYGNAWSFEKNREGLLRYWEDGLKRSAKWESMVTVGMRGERDSKVLGEEATLKDNIDLLKDIIHCQKKLIHKAEEDSGKTLPMLLALYKEVEPYYYGDEQTEGLCEWEELKDIILMLCEDNFGYMRTLPDKKMREHPAGFGMYYHLDYHGEPISYEWQNSTPLTKIWEQMSQAYDYGVRQVWIVNVGDLKFNEFPLSYFMNLAYDFEGWGTEAPGREKEYTRELLRKHFGGILSESGVSEAEWILSETVRLNGMRRPEALNPSVYHPCHYGEADRMLNRAEALQQRAARFMDELPAEAREACYSLFGFAALASANLLKLHLYAAQNRLCAEQGRKKANYMAEQVNACIQEDKRLSAEWAAFKEGKWRGME